MHTIIRAECMCMCMHGGINAMDSTAFMACIPPLPYFHL